MAFNFSPEEQRAWIARNLPAVQEKVSEPVVAYSLFQRSHGYARLALGYASPLASMVVNAAAKKKSAGLPPRFVLVLTPTRLYAYGYKFKRGGIKVREELAVWDRSAITAQASRHALTTRLVIESPAEGERVECEAGNGTVTDDFVRALGAVPAEMAA